MRNNRTSHLTGDLAQLHGGLEALRAEAARRLLTMDAASPEHADLQMSAEGLDEDLKTLRDPQADASDLGWVRSMWDGVSTSFDAWSAAPDPEAEAGTSAPDTWTSATPAGIYIDAEAVTPAAEVDAPEMEMEAAI
jgi:hypothetical protein